MNAANRKAFAGLVTLLVIMAALIFIPAWTLDYWQGWLFMLVFYAPVIAITLYVGKHDPKLLERRTKAGPLAEQETIQKIIQVFAQVAFAVIFPISVLDHRYSWSAVPAYVPFVGDAIVVLGFYIVFLVFKENSFASGTIEIGADQRVIDTGPYALVRHPMYIGALVMLFGVPLALGSSWGLLALIPMIVLLVARLLDEEKFLARNLAGYAEYQNKVKSRLVPSIW